VADSDISDIKGETINTIRTIHPYRCIHRMTLLLGLVLAVPYALAQAELPTTKLAGHTNQTQANGRIELRPDAHLPLFVEFDRSSALTNAIFSALERQRVRTTADRSAAAATLSIRGDVVLMGGPVFCKGAKVPMDEATERTLAAAATHPNPTITAGEAANTAGTVALKVAALKAATAPFWIGLAVSRMAEVLGEATGMKSAINTALAGDPRGICLSRCDDWKKVKQSAYAFVTFAGPDGKQEVRVLATVFTETLAPEEVVAEALTKAMGSITLQPATAKFN